MTDTRATIEANNEKFGAFLANGDATGLASLYTANAKVLPPDSEILEGRKAVQAFWQSFLEMGFKGGKLETLDVEEVGNMAREIGKFSVQIQQDQEVITARGKYVVIWKQEDGAWKMDVDIWNSITPNP
ncbi:MAG: hypothetical protein JWP00_814 [Chloroflexi bacterium]|jgi:uncharacterized protein (TIGR02246 family)|nr:hypothetical protein [Chloroflexota bacterium]